jgi:hypothetical protein
MPTLQAALAAVRAELGDPAGPPSEDASVATDGVSEEINETPPTNTADNVF